MALRVLPTPLAGAVLIEPDVHQDPRGYFLETYHAEKYRAAGITATFVQDNHSRSVQGTLRGLHAQLRKPQGKLIRVLSGEIYDVAVDLRRQSPTFKQWFGVNMSARDFRQFYIPPGFAHGFYVSSEAADVAYKCTELYDASDEVTLLWNDPALRIQWPVTDPIISAKDRTGMPLSALEARLPVYVGNDVK